MTAVDDSDSLPRFGALLINGVTVDRVSVQLLSPAYEFVVGSYREELHELYRAEVSFHASFLGLDLVISPDDEPLVSSEPIDPGSLRAEYESFVGRKLCVIGRDYIPASFWRPAFREE